LLGLPAVDRTLCVVPLSRAHGSETLALPTLLAGGTLFLKSPSTDLRARGDARDQHESSRRRADERRLHVDRWTAGPLGTDAL